PAPFYVCDLLSAQVRVALTPQVSTECKTAFHRGYLACVRVWQRAAIGLVACQQLPDAGSHRVHPGRIAKEVTEYLLVQPVAVGWCTTVGRVNAGDVVGLAGDASRIAEVRIPQLERVDRRTLQEPGKFANPPITGIELLPAVRLNQRAGEDDLVPRP